MGRLRTSVSVLCFIVSLVSSRASRAAIAWLVGTEAREAVRESGYLPSPSWSQEGEDVLLVELLPDRGVYVDVGAHDPFRFSNTKLLYDQGWSGINIDSTSDFVEKFERFRPRDINVRSLVGQPGRRKYFRFHEEALNTLSEERAQALVAEGWELRCVEEVEVRPLSVILDEADVNGTIDLLTIDAEGADLEILQSIDWGQNTFTNILVEVSSPAHEIHNCDVAGFLATKGYMASRVWGRSSLFELSRR